MNTTPVSFDITRIPTCFGETEKERLITWLKFVEDYGIMLYE